MSTRKEKIWYTVAGAVVFGAINVLWKYNKAIKNKVAYKVTDGVEDFLLGGLVGAPLGRLAASIFGTPNDTVNYKCYDNNNKIVYAGVAYEDRLDSRMHEHRKSGKIFSRSTSDIAKPRCEALDKEFRIIRKHRPKYNVQHNCL